MSHEGQNDGLMGVHGAAIRHILTRCGSGCLSSYIDSVASASRPWRKDVALLLLLFRASVFDLPSMDFKPPPKDVGGGLFAAPLDEPLERMDG